MPTTIITNAPADYDYGYATQVGTVDLLGRTFSCVVTMPADRITYQCGRYPVRHVHRRRGHPRRG